MWLLQGLSDIKKLLVPCEDYYILVLGDEVEVQGIKKRLLLDSSYPFVNSLIEDKYMVKYKPANKVYFDKDFIDNVVDDDSVPVSFSFKNKGDERYLKIASADKAESLTGYVRLSGQLSANGYVSTNTIIYRSSDLTEESAIRSTSTIALGMRNKKLLGLCFIPKKRGIAYSVSTAPSYAESVRRGVFNASNWFPFTIDDIYKSCRVKRVEDKKMGGVFGE